MAAEAYPHAATGTGGKYPKRSHQRRPPSTPYARPPAPGGSHRWLPKVLDPALKLFSSVLRRAPPQIDPPSPSSQGITCEPKEAANDMTSANPSMCEDYEGVQDGETQSGAVGGASISKIEDIVKQKTFSRSEYNRLTELLRARTVDLSPVNEDDRAIPNRSQPKDQLDKMKNASLLINDNERGNSNLIESSLKHGTVLNMQVPEMEIASPAELAKAYMGSRSSRPLLSSTLKSSPLREIAFFPDSSQKPAVGSVASRSVIRFSKLLENGHTTPEFQGRSSLHKLPQSSTKGHSSVKTKGSDQSIITYPESFRFQTVSSNTGLPASYMNLKRRSSVLDIDTGSARRTRQKSSLVTPSKEVKFSPFRKPLYTPSPHQLRDSMDYATTPCSLDSARYKNTPIKEAEDRDDKPSCSSLASVPQQSSLMAKKILQQLDHLVPSPKERYREHKLSGRDGSTTKSSFTTYLSGMAVGSKDAESSKIFNVEGKPPTPMVLLPDVVETSGPTGLCISGTMMTSQPNATNGCTGSIMQAKPDGLVSVQTIPSSIASTPQNNFFMLKQAPESPLKLDAETNDGKAPSSMLVGKENKGVSIGVECSPVSSETEHQKTIYLFDSSKNNDKEVTENTSLSAVASSHSSDTPAVASSFRQPDPIKEDVRIPAFSFGSKKSRSLVFSSTVARSGGYSGLKFPMKPELDFQIPMSISQVDKGAENVGEESPVFTFGSRSAAAHPSNGVTKPDRCVFSLTTQMSSNPVSNLSGMDNSTIFGTSSSLVGLGTSKSDPSHTSPLGGSCTTPLFNKSFSSPVQSDLKNPVGFSGLTSSFGFPAEAGSIFGFGISSGVGLDTSTPASMPTSLLVGPGSLLPDIIRPPLQSDSKDLDTMPFEKSGSASLASFSTQDNSVIGLISSSSSTSHGSPAAHLVVSQALCSTLEPSSSAHISYTASTAVFSSSFTFAPFSVTSSASATFPSMIGAPQAIASHPGGDQMKVGSMATFDTVQSCLAPASSDTSLPSPAPAVQSPIFHFGNEPSPALFQSHAIQPSGNSDSPAEGHLSIGSIGGDKSARRIIRVKRDRFHK